MRAARRAASVTFAQANRWTASGTNGDVWVCIMEESLMAAAEQEEEEEERGEPPKPCTVCSKNTT